MEEVESSTQDENYAKLFVQGGVNYLEGGHLEEAVGEFKRALSMSGGPEVQLGVAEALAKAGASAEMIATIRPYYDTESAPVRLRALLLQAALLVRDAELASWLVEQVRATGHPVALSWLEEAEVTLGRLQAKLAESAVRAPKRGRALWLGGVAVVVAGVVGVGLFSLFKPLPLVFTSGSTSGTIMVVVRGGDRPPVLSGSIAGRGLTGSVKSVVTGSKGAGVVRFVYAGILGGHSYQLKVSLDPGVAAKSSTASRVAFKVTGTYGGEQVGAVAYYEVPAMSVPSVTVPFTGWVGRQAINGSASVADAEESATNPMVVKAHFTIS